MQFCTAQSDVIISYLVLLYFYPCFLLSLLCVSPSLYPDFYLPQLFPSSCFPPLSGEQGSIYNTPCSTEVILTAAEKETYENLIAKKLQYILGLSELSDMEWTKKKWGRLKETEKGTGRKTMVHNYVKWHCILQILLTL